MILPWICSWSRKWQTCSVRWRRKRPGASEILLIECLDRLSALLTLLQKPGEVLPQGLGLLQELRWLLRDVHMAVEAALTHCSASCEVSTPTSDAKLADIPQPPWWVNRQAKSPTSDEEERSPIRRAMRPSEVQQKAYSPRRRLGSRPQAPSYPPPIAPYTQACSSTSPVRIAAPVAIGISDEKVGVPLPPLPELEGAGSPHMEEPDTPKEKSPIPLPTSPGWVRKAWNGDDWSCEDLAEDLEEEESTLPPCSSSAIGLPPLPPPPTEEDRSAMDTERVRQVAEVREQLHRLSDAHMMLPADPPTGSNRATDRESSRPGTLRDLLLHHCGQQDMQVTRAETVVSLRADHGAAFHPHHEGATAQVVAPWLQPAPMEGLKFGAAFRDAGLDEHEDLRMCQRYVSRHQDGYIVWAPAADPLAPPAPMRS